MSGFATGTIHSVPGTRAGSITRYSSRRMSKPSISSPWIIAVIPPVGPGASPRSTSVF